MSTKDALSKNDSSTRSSKDWKKSAHHGAGEWLAERGTSLVLIPLTLWAAYAAFQIAGGGFEAAAAFARVPLNAVLIALTMLISVWHMYMGVKVIIDDYLRGGLRGFSIFLTFLLSAALLIATGYALFVLHQGA
jgi:succinate dehydrogenase / fumarate reductase membrane anchor subunit